MRYKLYRFREVKFISLLANGRLNQFFSLKVKCFMSSYALISQQVLITDKRVNLNWVNISFSTMSALKIILVQGEL